MMSICAMAGDTDVDSLAEMVSAGCLHCKVTLFPLLRGKTGKCNSKEMLQNDC